MAARATGIVAAVCVMTLAFLAGPAATQQPDPAGIRVVLTRGELIEGRRTAILTRDWFYCYPPTGELILVPTGYMTDFASIPQIAGLVFDPFGLHNEAAVVHDWLYAVGETNQFEKANSIFLYAMMEQKVPVASRFAMHRAVSLGGRGAYGRRNEWDKRFGDPQSGQRLPRAPFRRPTTAVVAQIDCQDLENPQKLRALRDAHKSANWPRA